MSSYTTTHPKLPDRLIIIEAPEMSLLHYHGPRSPNPGYEFDFGPVYAHIQYHDGRGFRKIQVDEPFVDYERLGASWIISKSRNKQGA